MSCTEKKFNITSHKWRVGSFLPNKISKMIRMWNGWVLRASHLCLKLVLLRTAKGCCNESATVCKGNETPLSLTAETSFSLEGRFTIGYHVLGDDLNQWIWFSDRVRVKHEWYRQKANYFRLFFIFLLGLIWVHTCLFHSQNLEISL